jgi:hypothetical protein
LNCRPARAAGLWQTADPSTARPGGRCAQDDNFQRCRFPTPCLPLFSGLWASSPLGPKRSTFLRPPTATVMQKRVSIPKIRAKIQLPSLKESTHATKTYSPKPMKSSERNVYPVLCSRVSDSPFLSHRRLNILDSRRLLWIRSWSLELCSSSRTLRSSTLRPDSIFIKEPLSEQTLDTRDIIMRKGAWKLIDNKMKTPTSAGAFCLRVRTTGVWQAADPSSARFGGRCAQDDKFKRKARREAGLFS